MADAEPPQNTGEIEPAKAQTEAPGIADSGHADSVPSEKLETNETNEAEPLHKSLRLRLFETGVDAAGFGNVLKAWRAPQNRFRAVMKSIGSKAADMLAGRAVSSTFKLIALTWVAGMIGGVSTVGSIALLALAAGASSAIYSYHKDFLHAKLRGPKHERKAVKYFDKRRLRSAGFSFLGGTASGLFGSWLAKTGMLQSLLGHVKDFFTGGEKILTNAIGNTISQVPLPPAPEMRQSLTRFGLPKLTDSFAKAAAPAAPVAPIPAPVPALRIAAPHL